MKRIKLLSLLLLITLSWQSCKNDTSSATASATQEKKSVTIPVFNPDNAYAHIEKQLSFGFRVPGTPEHKACGEWIAATLKSNGAQVIIQDFKSNFLGKKDVPSFNIMAQFNPNHKNRILLAAHWDSRLIADKDDERTGDPIPGADDGASGVGVLLEIARILSENPIDMGIDLILFDAEDQGDNNTNETWALGSQYWSKNLVPNNYKAQYGILLDMVGSEGAVFGLEEYSYVNAKKQQEKVWTLAKRMGYSDFFREETSGAVMDDHFWVMKNTGMPMVNIINQKPGDRSSFGDYHHTHDDNISIISKRTLRVVGQVVTAAIYNESVGTL
jgi:glutaminyl-peptide cyclotransferase